MSGLIRGIDRQSAIPVVFRRLKVLAIKGPKTEAIIGDCQIGARVLPDIAIGPRLKSLLELCRRLLQIAVMIRFLSLDDNLTHRLCRALHSLLIVGMEEEKQQSNDQATQTDAPHQGD